ncbi:patatin-like phospholipase family protein [Kiritimatiella glycovorans]|uniref:NTE family protein RssA n=1 Tax=Kiritimatiella glycovorans TaxID=1307763 RepID=A0A0G3EDE1_9BACT|nr:patatin-like phospholipase family protein [Kiritimatiella glycovorans]AKJ64491.1 NTE family protein RssA [Kiritimatiella glycovorans]
MKWPSFLKSGDDATRPRIGLALGSGAARGWAHIGVIDTLLDAGVDIHCVAGTSMGALVGGVYAGGGLEALRELALKMNWRDFLYYFVEPRIPRQGLIDGHHIERWLRERVPCRDIGEMAIPFAAVSTDLRTGSPHVFREGPLIEAIRASISLPGMFSPVACGDRLLVDGGLVNPVPVDVAHAMGADRVIAVEINSAPRWNERTGDDTPAWTQSPAAPPGNTFEKFRTAIDDLFSHRSSAAPSWLEQGEGPNLFEVLGLSIQIMEARICDARFRDHPPDLLIRPEMPGIQLLDFVKADRAIEAGRRAAGEILPRVRAW